MAMSPDNPPRALLLVGPTGSGKTPLGDLLQARGLAGHPCAHFDFGARLRRVDATGRAPAGLTDADVAFVGRVLREGALLEDQHFRIAEAILRAFLVEASVRPGGLVVLNGLPRHVGQAADVGRIVDVRAVGELRCTADVVRRRIAGNIGGDRAVRVDDDGAAVAGKLAIYAERTAPLLRYYGSAGTPIAHVEVAAVAAPEDTYENLTRAMDPMTFAETG